MGNVTPTTVLIPRKRDEEADVIISPFSGERERERDRERERERERQRERERERERSQADSVTPKRIRDWRAKLSKLYEFANNPREGESRKRAYVLDSPSYSGWRSFFQDSQLGPRRVA
jgi:hypothetical protein